VGLKKMLHSVVLEKSGGPTKGSKPDAPAADSVEHDSEYVYTLIPQGGGYRVFRMALQRFLELAEPVNEAGRSDGEMAHHELDSHDLSVARRRARAVRGDGHGLHMSRNWRAAHSSGLYAHFGDIEIDVAARVVRRSGSVVQLAPLEFDLLVALFARDGAAASRRELLREVWGNRQGVTTRTVDTHIFNLRRKLEKNPADPVHLLTVSKIGYRLQH
jgi:hypothetical protein